jgi:lipoic acid synthetase
MPSPPPEDEPYEVAEAVATLGLEYAVITSVTRDDLLDGGASHFAKTIKVIKERTPEVKVEVLIPDFQGSKEALDEVVQAEPDVINHNLETVESVYPQIVRPRENYQRSLKVLEKSKMNGTVTKSGLMLGLGEKEEEILQTFSDLRRASCDLLTIGQYLQPTRSNIPLQKYYSPQEFNQLSRVALDFGFQDVEAGPLVRSSFEAHRLYRSLQGGGH